MEDAGFIIIPRAKYEEMEQTISMLTARVAELRQQLYGSTSEKSRYRFENPDQLPLPGIDESGYSSEPSEPIAHVDNGREITIKAHKRKLNNNAGKTLRQAIDDAIPLESIPLTLPEDQRICPHCGEVMREFGSKKRRDLVVIPIVIGVREYDAVSYVCPCCKKNNEPASIVASPTRPSVLPHTYASPELIAYLADQKFAMGCPLYRLERPFKTAGFPLTRQTMSSYLIDAYERYGKPLIDILHKQLLTRSVLHADETTLRVLRDEKGDPDHSTSYVWLYRTGNDGLNPIVLYQYCKNRSADNVRKFLDGYVGYLHVDGYQGYHNLSPETKICGCWAHARRLCDKALRQEDKSQRQLTIAGKAYTMCNELFEIERDIKGLPPDQLLEQRRERAKPVLSRLQQLIENTGYIVHEATRKAIAYFRAQWKYLLGYLADGRLEISNNRAERSIKPFVINRKNFLFSNTPRGAEASAGWMTLVATAQETGLNPYKYLVWLLQHAPESSLQDKNWAEKFLPCNAPETCK